jgi:hypothetical protein
MPTYYIRVSTEAFDREKGEYTQLIGSMEISIQMQFSKHDWELMTKAERGSIIDLKVKKDEY